MYPRQATFGFILLLMIWVAGCTISPRPAVETAHQDGQYSPDVLRQGGIAIGGVVLGSKAADQRSEFLSQQGKSLSHIEQAYLWGPVLSAQFTQSARSLQTKSFGWLEDSVEQEIMIRFLAQYAEGRSPQQSILQAFRNSQLDVRYLLMARIESDLMEYDSSTASFQQPSAGGLGRASDIGRTTAGTSLPLGPAIKRSVEITLELFDLEESFSVWKARVRRDAIERVQSHPAVAKEGLQVEKADDDSVVLSTPDRFVDGPEFLPVFEDCLKALLPKLLAQDLGSDKADLF